MYHRSKKGFVLTEILIAITIAAFVYIPVFSLSLLVQVPKEHMSKLLELFSTQRGKMFSVETIHTMPLGEHKECTEFLDAYKRSSTLTVEPQHLPYLGTSSLVTSIKGIGGNVLLGVDSSVPKESDMFLVDTNLNLLDELHTGPGTIDVALSGTNAFAISGGVSADMYTVQISNELQQKESCVLKADRYDGRKATAVTYAGDRVIVGFEKNIGPEIFVVSPSGCTVHQTLETGFGITDLYTIDDKIYVVGPADPELFVYALSGEGLTEIYTYDAPGLSGNGRSMDIYQEGIFFGRSRGNEELEYLEIDSGSFVSKDSLKIGSSVDVLITGRDIHAILTSNIEKELQFISQNTFGLLEHSGSVDLPERAVDALCIGLDMFVALQSTSTPIIKIHAQ